MLLFAKPEPCTIRDFLNTQLTESLTYPEVGGTNGTLPAGYAVNHRRELLGKGREAFDAACTALQGWEQLQLGWVSSWPLNAPLVKGEVVAVLGRAFGLWWLNACRVVYTIDERQVSQPRYGYAHGTLPDHIACGEERFLVEMDETEAVYLDILAFSKPNSLLAQLGYPYMRRAQKRFGLESTRRMAAVLKLHQRTEAAGDESAKIETQTVDSLA